MIIPISTHKGGVGKTATTQNLGAALALLKKKSLLVDFDPQCNLTSRFGEQISQEAKTITDYLYDENLEIVPISINKYLDIIPANDALDEVSLDMADENNQERSTLFLKDFLGRLKKDYDFILIDTAPGSSPLMVNALVAANEIIIPIADKDSMRGIAKLKAIIAHHKVTAKIHYLITLYDGRLSSNREINDYMLENSPTLLFHTKIRKNESVNQAANAGTDIFSFGSKSYGAQDYMSLAKELIGLCSKNK